MFGFIPSAATSAARALSRYRRSDTGSIDRFDDQREGELDGRHLAASG